MRMLVIVLSLSCVLGCSRRPGLNFDCNWVPDSAFSVDLNNDAHVKHLLDDIRVAEELGIRYGDRIAGWRLVETFGIVSRHGGLKNRDIVRPAQQKCLATLFHTIGSTHGLTRSDIVAVRPRLADRGFDLPITVPVLLLLAFAITRFIQWMRARFEADERLAWLFASLLGSLFIPTIVLGIGFLWAMLVEIVRLGNEHVGSRLQTESLYANFLVMFGIGFTAIWIGSTTSAIQKRADLPRQ